jgi:two-component system, OmpR family, sensor kinase
VSRSFRVQLAARFTAAMAAAVAAIGIASVLTLSAILDRELNASILSVASIQAASVTDSPSGEMRFHEWELTPEEAASVPDLMRYAQVWSEGGQSLLRSQFMTRDLPLARDALEEAGAGELVWREQDFQGTPVRSLYYPLSRFGAAHARHVLQVAAPLVARHEMVRRLAFFFAGVVLVVALTSFAGSWWLAGRAVRPVHEIIDQAEAIGAGSLDRRISAYADTREYRRLVEVLNTMLGRIQQAFEAQRRFTSDASHELRSPLTVIRGELELALRRDRTPDEYRDVLESSLEEVVRLSRITEDLLTLARSDAGVLPVEPRKVDIQDVARRIVDRLQGTAETRQVALALTVSGPRSVQVDSGLLGQSIWNLADNAIRYTPPGGRVEVDLAATESELRLEVRDTGPGLGNDPERLFQRFYRPEGVRTPGEATSGTGLGLAIVRAIAEGYGGRVEAGDRPEGGARVTVILPVVKRSSSSTHEAFM